MNQETFQRFSFRRFSFQLELLQPCATRCASRSSQYAGLAFACSTVVNQVRAWVCVKAHNFEALAALVPVSPIQGMLRSRQRCTIWPTPLPMRVESSIVPSPVTTKSAHLRWRSSAAWRPNLSNPGSNRAPLDRHLRWADLVVTGEGTI